ncbi:hypothetical protein MTP04_09470 [Lysinibacillus sp. PLM2]|nr:hypothetical protein MTP04_09470 [Lysinibacillus sp. PLM2]
MKKPVAFIIFNRPDTASSVFQKIREYAPDKLFVIADGPRIDKEGEAALCEETRKTINVDWECEVYTNFSNVNLGCRNRVSSGITWVFEHVEEAIILEDDCLPSNSFFRFCEQLLVKYKNDTRIAAVSGDNFQLGEKRTDNSYYFSRYPHCWGWATWKRAWDLFDGNMDTWPEVRDGGWLNDYLRDPETIEYWYKAFENVYRRQLDSWATIWTYTCWKENMLSILPNANLVTNIGFDDRATHTVDSSSNLNNLPSFEMNFPLKHPEFMIRDSNADINTDRINFKIPIEKVPMYSPKFYMDLLVQDMFNDLNQLTKSLLNYKDKNIYLFGTGKIAKLLVKVAERNDIKIINIIDNDISKHGSRLLNIEITKPIVLQNTLSNTIVLNSVEGNHDKQIKSQLLELNKEIDVISWKELFS